MIRFLTLLIFIAVLQGVGFLLGTMFPVDAWYIALNKPFFNPPGQVFGFVWPILYLLVAIGDIAGANVERIGESTGRIAV